MVSAELNEIQLKLVDANEAIRYGPVKFRQEDTKRPFSHSEVFFHADEATWVVGRGTQMREGNKLRDWLTHEQKKICSVVAPARSVVVGWLISILNTASSYIGYWRKINAS